MLGGGGVGSMNQSLIPDAQSFWLVWVVGVILWPFALDGLRFRFGFRGVLLWRGIMVVNIERRTVISSVFVEILLNGLIIEILLDIFLLCFKVVHRLLQRRAPR